MIPTRTRLVAGMAAVALAAGVGGFGLARLSAKQPEAKPEAAEAAPANEVVLSAAAINGAGIVVQPVSGGGLSSEVLAQANVVAAPAGQAVLTARAAGSVTRIFKRLGEPVRAGETLAVIESRDAAQITADRAAAQAKLTLASRTLAREKSLFEQRVSPRMDYEQAQAEAAAAAAEARRAQVAASAAHVTADGRGVAVTSPIGGRVTAAAASLGAFVQPETELFRINGPRLVQVEAAVSGRDADRVAVGDLAVLELADGRTLSGRVRSVTPSLDPQTRAATAVLELPSGGLQPGQTARVRIRARAPAVSGALVLPDEAVQSIGGRDTVFVRTPKGFSARPVMVGQRSAGLVEVVSGLRPGEVVAVRNAFLLKSELGKSEDEEG